VELLHGQQGHFVVAEDRIKVDILSITSIEFSGI